MPRLMTFTVAWLFAAVAATTAAWQGVSLVTDEVTENRPAAMAASEVRAELADGAADAPGTGSTTTAGPPASITNTTTTTTAPDAVAPVSESYRLDGGTVTISYSPTRVESTSVVPYAGFGMKKNEPEDGGWRVELESDGHRSRIDAWWDGGPQHRIREDPR